MQCNVFVVHYADTSFSFRYFLPSLTLIRHRRPTLSNSRAARVGSGLLDPCAIQRRRSRSAPAIGLQESSYPTTAHYDPRFGVSPGSDVRVSHHPSPSVSSSSNISGKLRRAQIY